jgi:hypothetical protein
MNYLVTGVFSNSGNPAASALLRRVYRGKYVHP